MSDSVSKPQSWSGPGIMVSFISLKKDSQLSRETLEKWFDDVYVPAVLGTGIVKSAWKWEAAGPDYDKQHMVIYKVPDLAGAQSGKLKEVPRTSELFPTDGPVDDFIDFESRIFSLAQLYETSKQPEGTST